MYKIERGTGVPGESFSLSSPDKIHHFFRSRGEKVSNENAKLCSDKEKTKNMLEKSNVTIPQGEVFRISDVS